MLGQTFEFVGTIVGSYFGSPETGQAIGQLAGEAVGGNKNLLGHNPRRYGERLGSAELTVAQEGEPIPQVYGTAKVGGQLIWCSQYLEVGTVTSSGGKGGTPKTKDTNYTTEVSFALGLCEGQTVGYGRIWVDGNPLDLNDKTIRFYIGTEDQLADPIIELIEGSDNAPAFRGLSYIVFEFLEVSRYGNRIPQIQVEVIRPLTESTDVESLIKAVTLIPASGEHAYAPFKVAKFDTGDREFDSTPILDSLPNINNSIGVPDVVVALDQLETSLPNVESVSIVVGWYGDDLRAGECKIQPRVSTNNTESLYDSDDEAVIRINKFSRFVVENTNLFQALDLVVTIRGDGLVFGLDTVVAQQIGPGGNIIYGETGGLWSTFTLGEPGDYVVSIKIADGSASQSFTVRATENTGISPRPWLVSGRSADGVPRVSVDADSGRVVYGGTPSDLSVYELIKECKNRGFRVTFYPFVFMDIPADNSLPNPYGGSSQPSFPWRGRITCHPAIGEVGTPDKTATAGTQVGDFFGSCDISTDFGAWNSGVSYYDGATLVFAGDQDDWSYRRMIYHYANLCKEAGGVDAFVIASELVGLTQVRSSSSVFPAVTHLTQIAEDVKTLLGADTDVTYAADWSEYHSYRPSDGTGDVYFNLDPLWASSGIDVIGIDNYMPLSDWRDGSTHLDAVAGYENIYDLDYLKDNIEGGEGYDWFYASQSDRDTQVRTPIVDTAYSKHWVFRQKDFKNWWLNSHYNRPAGAESGSSTAWTPQSKPIWFTEFGCPAVDKGTNQPNVFYDPKSSESFFPHYSDGGADDYIQRQYLTAVLGYWSELANNPVSSVYGSSMLEVSNCAVWTWDTRPFPDFPYRLEVWSDGDLYQSGHWIQGRLGQYAPLHRVVREICLRVGIDPDVTDLVTFPYSFRGMAFANVTSPMETLKSLMQAYQFVGYEANGTVKFSLKSELSEAITIDPNDLVLVGNKVQFSSTRTQANEIPTDIVVDYISPQKEYNKVSVRAGNGITTGQNVYTVNLPLVLEPRYASRLVQSLFNELYMSIEQVTVSLPLKYAYLLPNDIVSLTLNETTKQYRITGVGVSSTVDLDLTFVSHDIYSVFSALDTNHEVMNKIVPAVSPTVHFMDLPLLSVDQSNTNPRVAVYHTFPTQLINIYKVLGDTLTHNVSTDLLSTVGVLKSPLPSGPTDIWDNANAIDIVVSGKPLESKTEFQVMQGANTLAVEHRPGVWELVQFVNAELVVDDRYRLTKLRRGLLGTEGAMEVVSGVGSPAVLLDPNLHPHIVSVRGAVQTFKYGPESLPITDVAYTSKSVGFTHVALRPYSVVDVRHVESAGDITFTWLRRSRVGGFAWDYVTLPLGEEYEKYEIDVLDGSTVVRTVSVSTPSFTYTASQQTADFGSPPSSFTIKVYQISSVYGRGQHRIYEYNA